MLEKFQPGVWVRLTIFTLAFGCSVPLAAQAPPQVRDLGNGIHVAIGAAMGTAVQVPQSNTFMVVTGDGNVIVDTSGGAVAKAHRQALSAISAAATKAIVLTHAHGDHTGGLALWMEPQTQLIAHGARVEFLAVLDRLRGYFARSNAAQFGGGAAAAAGSAVSGRAAAAIEPTLLTGDKHTLTVGGVTFDVLHTPGETPDHVTVWIPQFKAAFVGDNYYGSFPNLYTLRGTQPRWAMDYVNSLNKVLALEPELVLPSHGPPIVGAAEVRRLVTRYRDAILFVHDETVKGMNEGKDVLTLMREIKLPPALDIGESYGKISWSVRGIYEGYVGWFDGNPSTMFGPASQAYPEMVRMAGGPEAVARRATELASSDPLLALYLTDMALAADRASRVALQARIAALQTLERASTNSNERGWLAAGIRQARAALTQR
jgi:alkyl sulfatase BDS1-like metallo-beta-lactamase superfamily hydrolase